MEREEENVSSITGLNSTEQQLAGVIHLRLDTTAMLDQLEAFLRGTRLIGYKETSQGLTPLYKENGKPKMNDEGIQSVMSWLTIQLSPHTVQGNFKEELYVDFICEFDIALRQMIMTNLHNWDVKIVDYNTIVDGIMLTTQPFFSRLIDNKERESYMQTLKTTESRTTSDPQSGGGIFGIFKK